MSESSRTDPVIAWCATCGRKPPISPDPWLVGTGRSTNAVKVTLAEYVCEETGDEVVLMKDASGHVIGFEKLNFSIPQADSLRVALETVPA